MPTLFNKRDNNVPADAVYIGRPSPYGNPFPINSTTSRSQSIGKFREYLKTKPNLIQQIKTELKDKDLVCWCAPLPCHGDVVMELANRKVFVFGSNEAGRHGKGAALFAKRYHGAIYGVGMGRQGNSYGIPTKDGNLKVLPLETISNYVAVFIRYAKSHPELDFAVTKIGCGLAGYSTHQIIPLFKNAPENCHFDWSGKTYGEPNNG